MIWTGSSNGLDIDCLGYFLGQSACCGSGEPSAPPGSAYIAQLGLWLNRGFTEDKSNVGSGP